MSAPLISEVRQPHCRILDEQGYIRTIVNKLEDIDIIPSTFHLG